MRLCAFTNMPTMRTFKDRGADVPLGSNSLEHRVQAISQFDGSLERYPVMPLGAQCFNHFRKPHSLRVTRGHDSIIGAAHGLSSACALDAASVTSSATTSARVVISTI